MRVLIVDDEVEVRTIVRRALEREGFAVLEADSGAAARNAVEADGFDVVVLDVGLPDESGLEVLAAIRARRRDLHVIMLTGAGGESDRVLGLVSGADDYVVKPFSPRELAARVLAVERHRAGSTSNTMVFGDLRIDLVGRIVTRGAERVELTRREFDLLCFLASHPGESFTRETLLETVWSSSAAWQQPTTVTEHVRRIRAKVERDPDNPSLILNTRGVGYRFDPSGVDELPAARSAVEESQDATVLIVGTEIRYVTPATLELLGATAADQVVGHDVFEFVAPHSIGASQARQESAKRGHWPRPEVITIVRRDGAEVLVELASAPVIWHDVGASQVTMWPLGEDTSRLRELATGVQTDVSDPVILTSASLRIRSFNEAAEQLYGWQEEEVLGRPITEVVGGAIGTSLHDEAGRRLVRRGSWHIEDVHRHRDGSAITVRSSTTMLRDSGGDTVGLIMVNRPVHHDDGAPSITTLSEDDALAEAIQTGIGRGEFVVHYQPVIWLESGRAGGVEALVRWDHPAQGLLPPAAFIGAAERSGVIVDLGHHVLLVACAQAMAWRHAGHDMHMAVNLSARQLAEDRFADRLEAVMAETRMSPGQLWLEMTETALVQDVPAAARALRRIDEIGARIVIDDFGTGWASLTYLREFPVHALKIDRSFVAGLGTGSRDEKIISSMLSLAYELDMGVVAEGVETTDQRAILTDLGCQIAQGYLFGRPVPADLVVLDTYTSSGG